MFLSKIKSALKTRLASHIPTFSVSAETFLRHVDYLGGSQDNGYMRSVISGHIEKHNVGFCVIYNQYQWSKEQAGEILSDIVSQLLDAAHNNTDPSPQGFDHGAFTRQIQGAAKKLRIDVYTVLIHHQDRLSIMADN